MSVVARIDLRAFPMEIAEHMLNLGKPLNMGTGIVGYNEAEHKLLAFLEVLDDYKKLFFYGDSSTLPLIKQKAYMIRYLQLHEHHPGLKAPLARQLLDNVNYFPVADPSYLENLDEDERRGY